MATKTAKKSSAKKTSSAKKSTPKKSTSTPAKKTAGSKSSGGSAKNSTAKKSAPASKSRTQPAKAAGKKSTSKNTSSSSRSSNRGGQPKDMMQKLMTDSLKDIYWAEKHLLKALKMMSREATSQELKNAFDEHRNVTEQHVERLNQVFSLMGMKPQGKKCEAMEGLIKEAEEVLEQTKDDTFTRDAALIMAAQKAEHYEIATYGTLATLAKGMGMTQVGELFGEILEDEKETDELLTTIAEDNINMRAIQESEQNSMEEE